MSKSLSNAGTTGARSSVCSCLNVRRAARAITRVYDKALESSDLKVTQFSILANILHNGPLSVSKLADILLLDRTTLVRNLKSLEVSQFVCNVVSGDPRERTLQITEAGRLAVERAMPSWRTAQNRVEEQIGKDGVKQLKKMVLELEHLSLEMHSQFGVI